MVWTRSVSRNTRRRESGDYCSSPVVPTADAQGGWEASEGAWESQVGPEISPGLPLTFPW